MSDPAADPRHDADRELEQLRAWRDATISIVAALAIYGEGVNLAAIVAKARALNEAELYRRDPRHADPVGINEIAGLAVAFKALVVRAGGRVEITEAELEHARELHARVDATPEVMTVELVDGPPPDVPRFAAQPRSRFAAIDEPRPQLADEPELRLGDHENARG